MTGCVGAPHGVEFDGQHFFFAQKGLLDDSAPVCRFPPHLMDRVLARKVNPGRVFDPGLPLTDVARGARFALGRRGLLPALEARRRAGFCFARSSAGKGTSAQASGIRQVIAVPRIG